MGAAIVGHAEGLGIGDAAPADLVRRFEHDHAFAGRDQTPPRGNAGGAGADHHDVDVAGARHRLGRRRRGGGRRGLGPWRSRRRPRR